jgi:hypothetical protein
VGNAFVNGTNWRAYVDSGFGPTDDLRIKPDLVVYGINLHAPSADSPIAVELTLGSSPATAVASGIGAVMARHFLRYRGHLPAAAELKAVLIHSAGNPRIQPVPSVTTGWGFLDAAEAGQAIAKTAEYVIETGAIQFRQTVTLDLRPTAAHIRATLVWTDLPGAANSGRANDPTPSLVNDLDLLLRGPGPAMLHHPFRLDPAHPSYALTNGPNRVDPVERIDADVTGPGTWTLQVSGFRVSGVQPYALVISGAQVVSRR